MFFFPINICNDAYVHYILYMTKEDIIGALKDNGLTYTKMYATALNNIAHYVKVNLKIDEQNFDYYYEIDVNDLARSNMPIDDLDDLKKEGWFLSDGNEQIKVYLKA